MNIAASIKENVALSPHARMRVLLIFRRLLILQTIEAYSCPAASGNLLRVLGQSVALSATIRSQEAHPRVTVLPRSGNEEERCGPRSTRSSTRDTDLLG